MTDKDTVATLNDLIETSKDGEYGFNACAEHLRDTSLKQSMLTRAAECRTAVTELQGLVVQHGGDAATHGSAAGAVHRGWVAVKGTLSGYSDVAVLDECERGEDVAMDKYRAALQKELPPAVRTLVERQYEGVKRNHAQVRMLRNQARASKA